jgi:vacuolar-type H+-ATPase subunit E/Vma4
LIKISEEKELKKQFGNLGLHLINQAQNEIGEINRLTLFQKARIKKRITNTISLRSSKLKERFIEDYHQFLNNSLSANLSKARDYLLNLKNRLIVESYLEFSKQLKENINGDYSNYVKYLLKNLKTVSQIMENTPEIVILFNTKDYKYFKKNNSEIKNYFKSKVVIENSKSDFIGGFKIKPKDGVISYDYTIDNLLNKNAPLIQMEFSKVISDSEIMKIEKNFEKYIQEKKQGIGEYLKEYDQI